MWPELVNRNAEEAGPSGHPECAFEAGPERAHRTVVTDCRDAATQTHEDEEEHNEYSATLEEYCLTHNLPKPEYNEIFLNASPRDTTAYTMQIKIGNECVAVGEYENYGEAKKYAALAMVKYLQQNTMTEGPNPQPIKRQEVCIYMKGLETPIGFATGIEDLPFQI